MTRTSLDHEMVRAYLARLDAALRAVPAAQARELREQICAHLDDALPADADEDQVAAVLTRLGSPAELAAEAGPAGAASQATPARAIAIVSLPRRLARVRRRTWGVLGVIAVLAGIATGYLVYYLTPDSLGFEGASGWWYPEDYSRAVTTTADGVIQTTVPLRSGQRQGYFVAIHNPAGVTQTILGPAYGASVPLDSPGSAVVQVGVSVPNQNIENGGSSRSIGFTLPGVIPPGQIRLVRVLWTSDICSSGGTSSIDTLALRVRVGWFTRTEVIALGRAWAVTGSSHGSCT
ncbi:MAG TPA: hypothetical protein VMC03_12940 [Streptosporangiaceae bacterium]|nr:hypothetical protein [Streptosporangiaceae bacterium]